MESSTNTEEGVLWLKSAILSACRGETTEGTPPPLLFFSSNETLEDLATADWILVTVPFIEACQNEATAPEKAQACAEQFMEDLISLKAVEPTLVHAYRGQMNGNPDRTALVNIARRTRSFRIEFADWEDREWLRDLLAFLFCKALRMRIHITREAEVRQAAHTTKPQEESQPTDAKTTIYKIGTCGHRIPVQFQRGGSTPVVPPDLIRRSDLLKRTGGPTMSLDEYADKVMEQMRKTGDVAAENTNPFDEDSTSTTSSDRLAMIKEDEINDQRRSNLGNTKGTG